MLQQLWQKTTVAPISLSGSQYGDFPECYYSLSGYPWGLIGIGIDEITLFPVAKRYDGGAPDLGYYYDPLDYSVAAMFVTNKVTVLPGTAIGFRNDDLGGFFLQDGSSFVAQGMATNPIIFTDIEFVQEGPLQPGWVYQPYSSPSNPYVYDSYYNYGGIDFICPQAGTSSNSLSPTLNLRFCNVYSTADDFPVWAGNLGEMEVLSYSWASSIYWTMQDCTLQGGQIVLGQPLLSWINGTCDSMNVVYPPGSISWTNNSFESVGIYLDPCFRPDDGWSGYYGPVEVTNVDLPVYVCNNLFIGGPGGGWAWAPPFNQPQAVIVMPTPTSDGAWSVRNNLFDSVTLVQDTNASQPFEADHNGYWSAKVNNSWTSELAGCWQVVSELTNNGAGTGTNTDQTLSKPPPYQIGPFGNY